MLREQAHLLHQITLVNEYKKNEIGKQPVKRFTCTFRNVNNLKAAESERRRMKERPLFIINN